MRWDLVLICLASATLNGCERQPSATAKPSRTPFVALSTVPPRFLLFAHWEKPRFQDRAAKEYLLEYDSFVDRFKYAYRALKAGNIAGYQCLFAEAEILREKATTLRPRLSAEEQKEMDRYQQIRATELPVASNR
jgi:hypothetical protein